MSATRLFDAGYTALVSVIPPDAELSPNSHVQADQRGKAPGRLYPEGWGGYPWNGSTPSRQEVAGWDTNGANVGLQAGYYPALDIDCSSKSLAEWVKRFALERLGDAPTRLSREPRRLMVYRTTEPFGRIALRIQARGSQNLVEFLCKDRQYLVHGRHPSGTDYRWQDAPLWEVKPVNLNEVTLEQVEQFMTDMAAELAARGLEVERLGRGSVAEAPVPQEWLLAPSFEQLAEVVRLIPNREEWGWDEYIQMAYAIRAAAGPDYDDEAFDLWGEWSAQHPRHDPATDEHEWPKIKPPCRVGWNWLQERAAQFSEYMPAQDEFESDPALEGKEPPSTPDVGPVVTPISLSDEWAVEQILPLVKDRLRYIPGSKVWYYWGGHRWEVDERMRHDTITREALARLAYRLKVRADAAPNAAQAKPFLQAAMKYQNDGGISAVVSLLRSRLAVLPTEFDTDTMALNTPGGIVNLRTGEIIPPTPSAMQARATRWAPQPGPAPLWERFMHDLTGGDKELQAFLQRMLGYCLTGDTSEKVLAYAWGSNSDTGKSTLIRTVAALMGNYHDSVDVSAFIGNSRGDRVPADLARLPGARLVTATEPAAGQAWDEKRIKSITGGDEISARFLYGQWFTYTPQFKILIVGNHEPELRQVDDALVRRFVILPMNRKVPRERQIEDLSQRMVAEEGPQITAWLVEGCQLWLAEGLALPDAVRTQTKEYLGDQDLMQVFVDERCQLVKEAEVSRHALYGEWRRFCFERGEEPGGERGFKGRFRVKADRYDLRDAEVQEGGQRRRGYKGIRLLPQRETIDQEFETE